MPLYKIGADSNGQRLLVVFAILITAISVRVLTLQFMRAHLNDASWFQFGSYAIFDRQAKDILQGRQRLFLIGDPSRTDLVQYPPAYPATVALIYKLTGNLSASSVQYWQWAADLVLSLILITGIAVTAFNWRVGFATAFLLAVSPLFAMYAAYPSSDTPTMWLVLAANWLLLIAAQRTNVWFALAAGSVLGLACWFRVNPLYLCVFWAIALFACTKATRRRRLFLSLAVTLGSILVISPIVIRNFLTFPDFTPTGGTIGTNLWEGLGETSLGISAGFLLGDQKMLELERVRMGLPENVVITPQWPDGIRRDRQRTREALAFIKQHPVWYAGVMLRRMWGMLKVAGEPSPFYGSGGINVTSQKCLPPGRQGGLLALFVNLLGMIQSVVRYLLIPLVMVGLYVALRKNLMINGVLLITVFYYLVPGTAAHTEIRYVLPMHALLLVFGGVGLHRMLQVSVAKLKL
ncbi:MAG TPA: glycosyltransferase family 39 protein [Pyrinomonadaceae bacterium]|nr:glycosyltransferase family 39 protein [Pyrinomonadaceae bacterium]